MFLISLTHTEGMQQNSKQDLLFSILTLTLEPPGHFFHAAEPPCLCPFITKGTFPRAQNTKWSNWQFEVGSLVVTCSLFWNHFFLQRCQRASLPPTSQGIWYLMVLSVLGPGDAQIATRHSSSNHGRNIFIFGLQFSSLWFPQAHY